MPKPLHLAAVHRPERLEDPAHSAAERWLVESEEIVKEVIDVFASFSETADPDEERSWVSENPFADENKPAEE